MPSYKSLHQVLAALPSLQSQADATITNTNKQNQKSGLFEGFSADYQPIDTNGQELPSEKKHVEAQVRRNIAAVEGTLAELFDMTYLREDTNCTARADVVVDGETLVEKAPATYLLFLEKRLVDVVTWIKNLPVLDTSEAWQQDDASGLYRSATSKTHRTAKIQKPLVLYPATPEHPAQTQIITQDELVGHWEKTRLSGAIPAPKRDEMRARAISVLQAVRAARMEANEEAPKPHAGVGRKILSHIFETK